MNGKNEFPIEIPRFEASETIDDVKINPDLDQEKQNQLLQLVTEFSDVSTDDGRTSIIEHEIKVISDDPIRSKPYLLPML